MQMPTITLLVQGGLGNRFRAIEAGVSLCKKIGSRLRLIWPVNAEMGAALQQLVQPSPDFDIIPLPANLQLFFSVSGKKSGKLEKIMRNRLPYAKWLMDDEVLEYAGNYHQLEAICEGHNVFIRTCHQFYFPDQNFSWAVPVASIAATLQAFETSFQQPVIGVHIRRGDHEKAILHSPDEQFVERMDAAIGDNPATRFFLATDDAATEERFKARYAERLITRAKQLDRATLDGIRDAFIDWLLLSRSSIIFHSYLSSFSETAAQKGGASLEFTWDNDRIHS